jgi:hypothetical protein
MESTASLRGITRAGSKGFTLSRAAFRKHGSPSEQKASYPNGQRLQPKTQKCRGLGLSDPSAPWGSSQYGVEEAHVLVAEISFAVPPSGGFLPLSKRRIKSSPALASVNHPVKFMTPVLLPAHLTVHFVPYFLRKLSALRFGLFSMHVLSNTRCAQ